jgi:hypothetical protein
MTVQTQVRPAGTRTEKRPVRGIKGFVFGMAALAAAGMGVGIGFAVTDNELPTVIAPDSAQIRTLKNVHAENYTNPGSPEQLAALQRHHEDANATSVGAPTEAIKRFKAEAWSK